MNETLSLLLATTVLAIGGAGLYMYKSDDSDQVGGDDYNEDTAFSSNDEINDADNIDNDYYEPKARSRVSKTKTKRNRKGVGTKRRY